MISSIASALAAMLIQRHLERGGTIEVPSLGITLGEPWHLGPWAAAWCGPIWWEEEDA